MSSGFEDFHAEWERQREALSALLDGELESGQRERLERHLATCERCRAEYATLSQTHALLRALPQPALPRSFALPVESPPNVRPISDAHGRQPARSGRFSRVAQRVGSLAAAAGLVLLIGSWLASFSGPQAQNASRSYSGGANSAPQNTTITTAAGAPSHTPASAGATRAPDVGVSTTPATGPATAAPYQPATSNPSNDSASSVPVLPLTGAGLTVGGVLLVVAGKAAKGRQGRG